MSTNRPRTSQGATGTLAMLAGPENAARRTGAAMVASALAVLPLRQVFTDWSWLPDVWTAMFLTLGPAALLRMRAPARSIHLLPGLLITVCYLTARFVPDHAWAGLLPLHGAWTDISTMTTAFGDTIRDSSAPLHSTGPVRLMLAAQLTLLAVVIDLLAVVARRPALAGVPFLLLFTIAGAVPRHAVGWLWFALSAAGYLLLLGSDTRDDLSRWGRLMPRNVGGSRAAVKALSARRIGVIAIVAAVAVPIILPVRSSNVLADAFHGGTGGSGKGGVSLSPFASLKGQLNRKNPQTLFKVTTTGLTSDEPFYLSQVILDRYNSAGWRQSDAGASEPLDSTAFPSEPITDRPNFVSYSATITIGNLDDNEAPIFQSPTGIAGLSRGWSWSPQNEIVSGGRTNRGDRYTEDVAEPRPTLAQLGESRTPADQSALRRWLQVPATMPPRVVTLVKQLTENARTPYDRSRAIFDFFSSTNGFVYSTSTKAGDSGSDLEDFLLVNRTGFCQQYAAAMSIMLRMADVPSRVVLGYTHGRPDKNGTFAVTTGDAHAWVEAYFAGVGWVPFDPTPLVGIESSRSVELPWAPHGNSSLPNATSSAGQSSGPARDIPSKQLSVAPGTKDNATNTNGGLPLWAAWLLIAVAVLLIGAALLPAAVRMWRRRARLRAAADGPDPLWEELADTAVDLGYVWSEVRSPRQVVTWLKREGISDDANQSLRTLAGAVEVSRYAAPSSRNGITTSMVDDLKQVEGSLRSQRTGWERARARMLPESLGWVRRIKWRGRH
jgi:transglutaminase-like putative cysteine protease